MNNTKGFYHLPYAAANFLISGCQVLICKMEKQVFYHWDASFSAEDIPFSTKVPGALCLCVYPSFANPEMNFYSTGLAASAINHLHPIDQLT